MPDYDVQHLKSIGFMKQKEKDLFSVRLRIVGGHVTGEQLVSLAAIAAKYGKGPVHLTTRQGVEIPYVHYANFEAVRAALAEAGLEVGVCGPRLRTVTACQGELCSHGLINTQEIAREVDRRFYGRGGLPHKFKICIAGCPNGCPKPTENDFGVLGVTAKQFEESKCNLCNLCVQTCPVGALALEEGKLVFRAQQCVGCAECISVCSLEAWRRGETLFNVYVGGKMGKRPMTGLFAFGVPAETRQLLDLLDATLEFYKEKGLRGERFGDTLTRVGMNAYREYVL